MIETRIGSIIPRKTTGWSEKGDIMKIIEYEDKYLEEVKDLLVELEEYILSIDEDNLDQLHPEYRDKMAILDLEEVKENNGKCYLAIDNNVKIKEVSLNSPIGRSIYLKNINDNDTHYYVNDKKISIKIINKILW